MQLVRHVSRQLKEKCFPHIVFPKFAWQWHFCHKIAVKRLLMITWGGGVRCGFEFIRCEVNNYSCRRRQNCFVPVQTTSFQTTSRRRCSLFLVVINLSVTADLFHNAVSRISFCSAPLGGGVTLVVLYTVPSLQRPTMTVQCPLCTINPQQWRHRRTVCWSRDAINSIKSYGRSVGKSTAFTMRGWCDVNVTSQRVTDRCS